MEGDCGEALDDLVRQLGECAAGTGQLALVSAGLAGGKTRLLHAFARRAKEAGALRLLATGSRDGAAFPVGVADQLFRSTDLPPEVAARASRLLAGPPDGADEAGVVHELCLELLALARADRPLVVLVDDVQFADAFTLRLLLHLRQRIASAHVMVVLSEWSWAQPDMTPFHAGITQYPHRRIRLRPMDEAGVLGLMASRPDDRAPRAHVAEVLRLTGGNPLLVAALLDDLAASGPGGSGAGSGGPDGPPCFTDGTPAAGPAFAQAVLNCLYRWDPVLLTVAQGVAVLGREASAPLVAELVSLPVGTVERVLATLSSAGVLDGAAFRHPSAESAVLGAVPAGGRARLQVTAAGLLHRAGGTPGTVAAKLLEAARVRAGREPGCPPSGGAAAEPSAWPSWAAGVLREAASEAAAGDDVGTVTRCLELALEVSADPDERDEVRRALARAVWRVDPAAADRWQEADRGALERGGITGRDALPLLRQALWRGDRAGADRAQAAYESGADAAGGRGGDLYAEAELLLARKWFYGARTDTAASPEPRTANTAPGKERLPEDPWIRAVRAIGDGCAGLSAKSALTGAEHVLESCRLDETMLEVVLAALLTLVRGDRPETAAERTEALRAQAVRRGGVVWQAALDGVRADLALRCGELVRAAGLARGALELLPARSWGMLRGYPLSVLISAQTLLGQHGSAEASLRALTPELLEGSVWGACCLYARGQHHLATDRVLAAVKDFQACARITREREFDVAELVPWRNGLAEANLRLGRTAAARDLLKQQLGLAQEVSLRTQGATLRLAAAAGELAQRPALLRRSVDALQAAGDRMELSRALTDLSVACRGVGELDQARAASWRAAQEAKLCRSAPRPAPLPGPRAAARPDPFPALGVAYEVVPADEGGGEPTGPLLLSDAESRVALLAARGFSNREISQQLFITVSTVEQHLTRVYRKLGVSSRRALPTRLLAQQT
ncbi:helix-turn-helix transcriptional regulator [Streptomyces chilikensis]|uniref:AAA family ATPase n=1 Tax=Streptomyces chilikensis TaxID=1194079 RepID=A0ABV3EYP9_9ACTN